MSLNKWPFYSDKTSKVFCINICCFSTKFRLFVPWWHRLTQVSQKMCSCLVSTPHNSTTFTVPLAGNDHYQGNGVAVDVLAFVTPLHHTNFVVTVLRIYPPGAQKPRTWLRIWCVTGVTWQSFSCKQLTSYVTFYHPNFFVIGSRSMRSC